MIGIGATESVTGGNAHERARFSSVEYLRWAKLIARIRINQEEMACGLDRLTRP